MKVLITGICGFAGSSLGAAFCEAGLGFELLGVDNFSRPGSETNRSLMRKLGVQISHADLRCQSDIDALPDADWIIDCAAMPSVLAGVSAGSSSRQVLEHNLLGTINLLEKCKRSKAGFLLLSTSRVYSIPPLASLRVSLKQDAFVPDFESTREPGLSSHGIAENFSTAPPVSLYGATKVASELLALEYGQTFTFPVWINRCGVLAGAGQFGKADQGIFSYWIHRHCRRAPLTYIGFGGKGWQVRDCLHPRDLAELIRSQLLWGLEEGKPRVINCGGGIDAACSLRQLHDWCDARFGKHPVASEKDTRPFDLPWVVLDSRLASTAWNWAPRTKLHDIFEEIARHAEEHPDWLELSSGA